MEEDESCGVVCKWFRVCISLFLCLAVKKQQWRVQIRQIYLDFCVLFVFSCFKDCSTLSYLVHVLSYLSRLQHAVIPRSSRTWQKKSAGHYVKNIFSKTTVRYIFPSTQVLLTVVFFCVNKTDGNQFTVNSAFNKHRHPTKNVSYFDQRRRLLFSLNWSN